MRFCSLLSTYIYWMIGFFLSLVLKRTHRQLSRRAIDCEEPSISKAAGKEALSCACIVCFFSLSSRKLSQRSVFVYRPINPLLAMWFACIEAHTKTAQPPLGVKAQAKQLLHPCLFTCCYEGEALSKQSNKKERGSLSAGS